MRELFKILTFFMLFDIGGDEAGLNRCKVKCSSMSATN